MSNDDQIRECLHEVQERLTTLLDGNARRGAALLFGAAVGWAIEAGSRPELLVDQLFEMYRDNDQNGHKFP